MSMTREEAIRSLKNIVEYWTYKPTEVEAAKMAIDALRPVSRERVERMRGEWISTGAISCKCSRCNHLEPKYRVDEYNCCPYCMAPMTDAAVDMVMERLEALKDGSTTD